MIPRESLFSEERKKKVTNFTAFLGTLKGAKKFSLSNIRETVFVTVPQLVVRGKPQSLEKQKAKTSAKI